MSNPLPPPAPGTDVWPDHDTFGLYDSTSPEAVALFGRAIRVTALGYRLHPVVRDSHGVLDDVIATAKTLAEADGRPDLIRALFYGGWTDTEVREVVSDRIDDILKEGP